MKEEDKKLKCYKCKGMFTAKEMNWESSNFVLAPTKTCKVCYDIKKSNQLKERRALQRAFVIRFNKTFLKS